MKKTLIVIDMQNDFIDGSLGTKEAVAIVDNVKKKIDEYKNAGNEIIFTRDTHFDNYLETQEGRNLPVKHCIEYTEGHALNNEVMEALKEKAETLLNEYKKAANELSFVSSFGVTSYLIFFIGVPCHKFI